MSGCPMQDCDPRLAPPNKSELFLIHRQQNHYDLFLIYFNTKIYIFLETWPQTKQVP